MRQKAPWCSRHDRAKGVCQRFLPDRFDDERATRPERRIGTANHARIVRLIVEVSERSSEIEDEIERHPTLEGAHVTLDELDVEPLRYRRLRRHLQVRWRHVDPRNPLPPPGEFNRVTPRTTAQVEYGCPGWHLEQGQ
jgi:hypothetical protein